MIRSSCPLAACALIAVLAVFAVPMARAVSPDQFEQAVQLAQAQDPDATILEVEVDDGPSASLLSFELSSGREVYIDAASGTVVETEFDEPNRSGRSIAAMLADFDRPISLAEAYRRAVSERIAAGGDREMLVLYEIEYDLQYGRLVIGVEFRAPAEGDGRRRGWQRSDRFEVYLDPADGTVLTTSEDD